MASRRTLKAAQAIREVVGMALLTQIKDPRIKSVNVTKVEVSSDMRSAKVYVIVRGGVSQEKLALCGLTSAAGFLQQKCAERIDTRYTPRLQFMIDEGVKNLIAVTEILEREKQQNQANNTSEDADKDENSSNQENDQDFEDESETEEASNEDSADSDNDTNDPNTENGSLSMM